MSDQLGRHTNECDYCLGMGWTCPQCKGKGYIIENLDKYVKGIRRGDILLIKYIWDFPIGWLIRKLTNCRWNHVGWFINDRELIELKAVGKRKVPLSHYLNKWLYKCKVVRIKNILPRKLNEAIGKAEKAQFNYSYSSAIINLILIKLKIRKKFPRLSCSGFPAYYLAQVDFYFNGQDTFFIMPKDIEISKKIKDVTNELCYNYPLL